MVFTIINGSDCFNDSILFFSLIIIAMINLMIAIIKLWPPKYQYFLGNITQNIIKNNSILMIAIIKNNDSYHKKIIFLMILLMFFRCFYDIFDNILFVDLI